MFWIKLKKFKYASDIIREIEANVVICENLIHLKKTVFFANNFRICSP